MLMIHLHFLYLKCLCTAFVYFSWVSSLFSNWILEALCILGKQPFVYMFFPQFVICLLILWFFFLKEITVFYVNELLGFNFLMIFFLHLCQSWCKVWVWILVYVFSKWLLYRSNRVYWIINLFLTDLKCHLNHVLNSHMYFGFFLDFSVLPMDLFIHMWSHIVLVIIFGHLFLYLIS